ncbi:MAG: hypothetical protein PUP91_15475 [Rhizonema sp. PD37]|nr:hypothetical protein [Rhizonema sp. PD37]
MEKIVYPVEYRIIQRHITPEKSYWHFLKGKVFFNPLNLPTEGDPIVYVWHNQEKGCC